MLSKGLFFCMRIISLLQSILHVSSQGLDGMNLRIAGVNAPPFDVLTRQPDGNYTLNSSNFQIWQLLSEKLNFTITMIPMADEALNAKLGVYEAAIYKLANQEVDGIAVTLIVTPERKTKFDFTSLVWSEPYTLIVPKPTQKSRLFAFIRPLQPAVWLGLAITTAVLIAIMSCFSLVYNHRFKIFPYENQPDVDKKNYEKNPPRKRRKISKVNVFNNINCYTVYFVSTLTNQGSRIPYVEYSFRILAGSWLLVALVLVNSYSSIVVSSLMVPEMNPAVNSFQDLVNNKEVSLVLRQDIIVGRIILNASTGVLKTLANEIVQRPDRMFLENPPLLKKLSERHYAYPFINSFNRDFVSKKFKEEGKCNFQISNPLYELSGGHFVYLVKKNFEYTPALWRGMIQLYESGIIPHLARMRISNSADQCFIKNEKPKASAQIPITKQDLTSAFLILGIGLGLSVLSFLIELLVRSFCEHNKVIIV